MTDKELEKSLGHINHIANMCYAVIIILFIAAMVAIFLIGSKFNIAMSIPISRSVSDEA